MKRSIKEITVATLFVIILSSLAFAEDTKVTVSMKAWSNKWEEKAEFADGTSKTYDLGSAIMVGPAINVSFGKGLFVGATYLKSMSDYEFHDWADPSDTVTVERSDLDLTFGYMFTQRFGVFAGYKSINASSKYTLPSVVSNYDLWKLAVKGPGIGILGNIPLSESVALYGNLAIMKLKEDLEFNAALNIPKSSSDMTGASLEVGVAFAFSQALSGNVGFKAQSFVGDKDEFGDKYSENFSGLTIGLNYTF